MTFDRSARQQEARGLSPWLARALPFALFMSVLALRSLFPMSAAGAAGLGPGTSFDARWLYGLQALGSAVLLFALRHHYRELLSFPRSPAAALASVLAGLALFAVWITPVPAWMHLDMQAAAFVPVDERGDLRWDLIGMRVLGAVAVVPIMEEIFWRSFLMRWVDRRDFLGLLPAQGSRTGIFLSSAVFASAHDLWLTAFLAGCVYAALFRRWNNLWYAIVAHATTNLALAVWVVRERAWGFW